MQLYFFGIVSANNKAWISDSDFDNQLKNKTHAVPDSSNLTYWLGAWFFCIWSRANYTYFARDRNYSDLVATDQGW